MNYENAGNRYTAIFVRQPDGTYRRSGFDIVRFNADSKLDAPKELVPVGSDQGKIFERVWLVDQPPYAKKVRV